MESVFISGKIYLITRSVIKVKKWLIMGHRLQSPASTCVITFKEVINKCSSMKLRIKDKVTVE